VYLKQDSINLKPWLSYAQESLVGDSHQFAQCISDPVPARIARGRSWAEKLGVHSTPTIIVDGWRWSHPPGAEELSGVLVRLLAGEPPYPPPGDSD
ncbi:MAG: hypothetical protein E4G90_02105, partial [Gemmatimonadales bacterium]